MKRGTNLEYMRHVLLIIFSALWYSSVYAQVQIPENSNPIFDKGDVFDEETSFEAAVHTNGFYIGYTKGQILTYYKTKYFHIDLGMIRHPKEISTLGISNLGLNNADTGGKYVFGKQNHAFALRVGYGIKRFFSEKAYKRGVSIGYNVQYGGVLGILKPYYLQAYNQNTEQIESIRYSDETRSIFLEENLIQNRDSFFKGFSEPSFRPGVYSKASLHFDFGTSDALIKAFDMGLMLDFYLAKLDILVPESNANQRLFINFFISLEVGFRR